MLPFIYVFAGLTLLFIGGEILVKGSVAIATRFSIPAVLIGMTIVAIGTSMPEIVINIQAALKGHPDIAIGNILGSNISNIFLALGGSLIAAKITVAKSLTKRDIPILFVLTLIMTAAFFFDLIERSIAILIIALFILQIIYIWKQEKKSRNSTINEIDELQQKTQNMHIWLSIAYTIIGVAMLTYAADILVIGAVDIAETFNIPQSIIAITIVAVGGSAPEIATCIISTLRGHTDIAIGNIVGSNLINLFLGIGIPALIIDIPVDDIYRQVDIWVHLIATIWLYLLAIGKFPANKITGGVFILSYIIYITVRVVM